MADYFLGALKALERRSKDNVLIFSDVLTERLDALVESMIYQKISDNDYLKTLELYYKKYQRFENHKGMYFCILRMQQIMQLKNVRKRQENWHYLEFTSDVDSEVQEFLKAHKSYYQNAIYEYARVFLLILLAVTIAILVLSVLVFQVPFLIGWLVSIAFYAGVWFFGKQKGIDFLMEKQIQKLYPDLDTLCQRLDCCVMKKQKKRKKNFLKDLLTSSQSIKKC
ncbi:hypothetical protein [Faecalicoccus pleomorphus]|uniref:hypothetical protein n=1 Tax=Faecalicoccus pleomorphus TaxID=1323 RepID=UPI00242F2576|nr:hypothetical protein [Faecalicoccus pleomorphus]